MSRHRAVSDRSCWRRSSAQAVVPAQRRPGIELLDARTQVGHWVSSDELLAGRQRGDYQALCGARLLAASLTEPGRGRRRECTS